MINSYESSTKTRSVLTEVYTQKRGTCVTVVILGIIIGIFAFAYITFGNDPIAESQAINSTLKLVSIIFQHGQTPPKYTYPNDPYRNDSRWQIGLGELTKKGKQNMYSLGKYFRERYSGFLPELYFASDLDVQSPNADACLMSAAVLLAGLYPPHKYQIWNPTILWQPIPVKGISAETDMMLDLTANCPQLKRRIIEVENSIKKNDEKLPKLYEYLSENTGMEFNNLSSVLALYNLLYAQEKNNLPLPEWTQSVYPNILYKYAIQALQVQTENRDITSLSSGILLDKINVDMKNKNANNTPKKMFLYAAHEKSIVNLLRILDRETYTSTKLKPEFSSAVIFELHVISGESVVQAFYLPKNGKIPAIVNITECGSPCSLENFSKYVKPFVLRDRNWESACYV